MYAEYTLISYLLIDHLLKQINIIECLFHFGPLKKEREILKSLYFPNFVCLFSIQQTWNFSKVPVKCLHNKWVL